MKTTLNSEHFLQQEMDGFHLHSFVNNGKPVSKHERLLISGKIETCLSKQLFCASSVATVVWFPNSRRWGSMTGQVIMNYGICNIKKDTSGTQRNAYIDCFVLRTTYGLGIMLFCNP